MNAFKLEELNCLPFVEYQVRTNSEGLVEQVDIHKVNLQEMAEAIYPRLDPKNDLKKHAYAFNLLPESQKKVLATEMLIFRYCIFRILTHYQLYRSQKTDNNEDDSSQPQSTESKEQPKSPANRSLKENHPTIYPKWGYRLGEDYYGQELEGVYLYPEFAQQLDVHFDFLKRHNSSSQIEYILQLEHGRVLQSLKNQKWQIKQISPDQLYFSNQTYQEKCHQNLKENPEYAQQLQQLVYPRGIAIYQEDLDRYKVIDGYHRLVGRREGESPLIIYHK